MLKLDRDYIAENELNFLEHKWWNNNAQIISQVWEMHRAISWSARKRYLVKAKEFFRNKKKQVTVLELGCGTGWVGQFIAGKDLKIIGIDFSESQIKLAKKKAYINNQKEYCDYIISGSIEDWSEQLQKVDGVLIHSFIHHLDGKEIEALICNLKDNLKKGSRIWIYEPAFYSSGTINGFSLGIGSKFCLKFSSKILAILQKLYAKYNLIDGSTKESFKKLTNEANNQGWYLSPKEIPFDVESFSKQLSKYFQINNEYWATIYLIGWIFETNLLINKNLRNFIKKTIIPFISYTDYKLSKEKEFIRQKIIAPNYAFHVWECVKK